MRNDLGNLRHQSFPMLVVEGNKDHQLIIQYSLLTSMPLARPVFVSRAKEAVAYLKYSADKQLPLPQLVVLDICLPNVSAGWQLVRDIRCQCPRLPIVVLTSIQEEEVLNRAYQLGANIFILKPSDLDGWERSFRIIHAYWAIVVSPATT